MKTISDEVKGMLNRKIFFQPMVIKPWRENELIWQEQMEKNSDTLYQRVESLEAKGILPYAP